MIHDKGLRDAVDRWMHSLDGDMFVEHLPLFRRAFSNLDRMQRRRLLDALFGRTSAGLPGRVLAPDAAGGLATAFRAAIATLLSARPADE